MDEAYCIYEGPVERGDVVLGGAVNLRTRQGFVIAAFATEDLARHFMAVLKLDKGAIPRKVIPLSLLGTADHPRRASRGLPQPFRKILFPSREVLSAWTEDREHFDTAPYVSKL
jgi:hypothetical protein